MSSKRALWIAAVNDDERSARLVQITVSHTRIARQISDARRTGKIGIKAMSEFIDQLDSLRQERDLILKQLEEEFTDGTVQ